MKYLKTFEGKTFDVARKSNKKSEGHIDAMRTKVSGIIGSKGCTTKKIGSDLEIFCKGKHIGNVLFRGDFMGLKEEGKKFTDKFGYNELGKLKQKIQELIK